MLAYWFIHTLIAFILEAGSPAVCRWEVFASYGNYWLQCGGSKTFQAKN